MPVAGLEAALDGGGVVAEAVGEVVEGGGLFDRVSWGEGAEPAAGGGEGGAADELGVAVVEGAGEVECAPGDAADGY
jgi:hypothetical protein